MTVQRPRPEVPCRGRPVVSRSTSSGLALVGPGRPPPSRSRRPSPATPKSKGEDGCNFMHHARGAGGTLGRENPLRGALQPTASPRRAHVARCQMPSEGAALDRRQSIDATHVSRPVCEQFCRPSAQHVTLYLYEVSWPATGVPGSGTCVRARHGVRQSSRPVERRSPSIRTISDEAPVLLACPRLVRLHSSTNPIPHASIAFSG